MDTFENNELDPQEETILLEPEPTTPPVSQPQPTTYSGMGAGRKESPYANSPYEIHHQPESQYQPRPVSKPKKEKSPGRRKRILAILLVLALVGGLCGSQYYLLQEIRRSNASHYEEEERLRQRIQELEDQLSAASVPGSIGASRPVDGSATTPAQLYADCVNSVVAISSTISTNGFYGISEGASSGSGFLLTEDGYVVTNYHVVENATKVEVILHDGTEYPAEVVGHDASNDIAVLKLSEEASGLKAASIGSSSALNIGDMVVAIGNPLGELASTQTVGYVSGINREVTTDNTIINMIQTDAAINPGNSGGPLFNMYGQVIGITTAKYSGTTGSGASIEGIGFAIPIDDVYAMINDLIDYGYVTGAYLGVTVQNMDPASAEMYGLPIGAYVVEVVEDGSADRAGVQAKDIIVDLGGHEVGSINELTRALRNFKAEDTTTITVVRGGQEKILTITLDEKPQDLNAPAQDPGEMPADGSYDEWYDYFRRYFGE